MLTNPMDVLTVFPVRKTKVQKQAFRDAVQSYAGILGYETMVESGKFGVRNLILGDPETARFLVTAHYDTCAQLPIPNWIAPCNFWAFLGYQLVLTLLILIPPFALGILTGLAVGMPEISGPVGYIGVWIMVALMLFGPANPNNANDNTSGVVTLLEIAKTLPQNQRSKVCFVLFDLEEGGLLGSAAYRKAHRKASDQQIVLNLDCVGDGNHIRFFPTKKLKQDRKRLTALYSSCGYFGKKDILVQEKGFSIYPSDQMNFPYGVGICALRRGKAGFSMGRIHTPKDTVLEATNINLLRAALTTYLTQTPDS